MPTYYLRHSVDPRTRSPTPPPIRSSKLNRTTNLPPSPIYISGDLAVLGPTYFPLAKSATEAKDVVRLPVSMPLPPQSAATERDLLPLSTPLWPFVVVIDEMRPFPGDGG